MKQGTCTKCGKEGNVVMHHTNGYEGENKDIVHPYCVSCHVIIHNEARKTGKCKIPVKQLSRLSKNSYNRRDKDTREITFNETIVPNVLLVEHIFICKNRLNFWSGFIPQHGNKLLSIDISEGV